MEKLSASQNTRIR